MKISFSPPNDLELAASREELAATARRIEQLEPGGSLRVSASVSGSPFPYVQWLQQLDIQVTDGPAEVVVREDSLEVHGSLPSLRAFASFLILDREEPGSHHHFEYYEGNELISPDSLPLVVASRAPT